MSNKLQVALSLVTAVAVLLTGCGRDGDPDEKGSSDQAGQLSRELDQDLVRVYSASRTQSDEYPVVFVDDLTGDMYYRAETPKFTTRDVRMDGVHIVKDDDDRMQAVLINIAEGRNQEMQEFHAEGAIVAYIFGDYKHARELKWPMGGPVVFCASQEEAEALAEQLRSYARGD